MSLEERFQKLEAKVDSGLFAAAKGLVVVKGSNYSLEIVALIAFAFAVIGYFACHLMGKLL